MIRDGHDAAVGCPGLSPRSLQPLSSTLALPSTTFPETDGIKEIRLVHSCTRPDNKPLTRGIFVLHCSSQETDNCRVNTSLQISPKCLCGCTRCCSEPRAVLSLPAPCWEALLQHTSPLCQPHCDCPLPLGQQEARQALGSTWAPLTWKCSMRLWMLLQIAELLLIGIDGILGWCMGHGWQQDQLGFGLLSLNKLRISCVTTSALLVSDAPQSGQEKSFARHSALPRAAAALHPLPVQAS